MTGAMKYTNLAHRYTARYPMLTYLGIQISFWIIANVVLLTIMHLEVLVIRDVHNVPMNVRYGPMLYTAFVFGVVQGIALGLTGYYLDRSNFRNVSMGRIVVLKALMSLAVLMFILALLKYALFDLLTYPSSLRPELAFGEAESTLTFFLLLIYYFFMTLMVNFINQVNKRYGPGIVIPLMLGHYRSPKEEERMFMFMDLKSSTTTAEKLGHLKYSAFIRDCFTDINEMLYAHGAQVYQYVGDEIVVTWPEHEGIRDQSCIRFFFACRQQFEKRLKYYTDTYGSVPDFKAGLHTGIVTVVEIGNVKTDIAYHGDTLNTAARIQSVCNDYKKSFLVSELLFNKLRQHLLVKSEQLGMILLKGKTSRVGIVSIDGLLI